MSDFKVFGILKEDTVNAPGISMVVFLQGCTHPEGTPDMDCNGHCAECHNPQSWALDKGDIFTQEQLIEELQSSESQKTLVLSGGEPIVQIDALIPLCKEVKEKGYTIWLYSGYTFEQLQLQVPRWKELAQYLDVLVDGPFIPSLKSFRLKFRGSKNQRILDVQKSIAKGKPVKKT